MPPFLKHSNSDTLETRYSPCRTSFLFYNVEAGKVWVSPIEEVPHHQRKEILPALVLPRLLSPSQELS